MKQTIYSFYNNEKKETKVDLNDLPEFIAKYNPKEVTFIGNIQMAKKIAEKSKQLQGLDNNENKTKYIFNELI